MTHDTSPRVAPVPRMALSVDETGMTVDLCGKTVGKLISDGRLRCVTVGTRRLVPLTEIQRWLDREAAGPGPSQQELDREAALSSDQEGG